MNEEINSILVDVWFRRLDTTVATRKVEAINLAQVDAYANARVREVLKALEKIARDRHEIALSGRHNCDEGENPEVWEAVAVAMAHSYATMETHVRALMPKEPE